MKPIDELKGRELDAAVAEEVMGWTDFVDEQNISTAGLWGHEPSNHYSFVPHYSTDIAAAWTVVEKVGETTPGFSLIDWPPDGEAERWVAQIGSHNYPDDLWGEALAPTAPEAICRAALTAVRAK